MGLPSVFVIGDSISIDYHPYLEEMLKGAFAYDRKGGLEDARQNLDEPIGANGGDSRMVLAYLRDLKRRGGFRPDYLLINCGLHDIKTDPQTGTKQVPVEEYRENLRSIVALVREIGSQMVWVQTTPVDEERHNRISKNFYRFEKDCAAYADAAEEIMREEGVPVLRLGVFTRSLAGEIFRDHVHFTPEVSARQAAYIAGWLAGYVSGASAGI